MVHNQFTTILALALTFALSACVNQSFENGDTPIVQNQSNREDMAVTRISLGLGYLKMGNMPQAKQNLEKAKKFAPDMVQVYTAFAHYYETVGENKLTIESYETALSLDSEDADTLNNYGVYLCRQDQLDAAEEKFLKAIAVPTYLLVSKSYENLASCFLKKDHFDKAEHYLNKAIMHSPSNASVLFQMVRLQYAMGAYQQAKNFEQRFEKVTRRFTPQSLALAFKVYSKLGQRRTAKNYGSMLVKMYPQSWEAQQYLLNELELIDADNLAKRYQLTQAKEQSNKPKKRIVKLSPKKSVTTRSVANTKPQISTSAASQVQLAKKTAPTVLLASTSASFASTQSINAALSMAPTAAPLATEPLVTEKVVDTSPAMDSVESASNSVVNANNSAITSSENPVINEALAITATAAPLATEPLVTEKAVETDTSVASVEPTSGSVVNTNNSGIISSSEKPVVILTAATKATQKQKPKPEAEQLTSNVNNNSQQVEKQAINEGLATVNVEDKVGAVNEISAPTKVASEPAQVIIAQEDREVFHVAKKPEPIVENEEEDVAVAIKTVAADSPESDEIVTEVQIQQPSVHTVTKGDTLYGISVKYNVKIEALRRWNNLSAKKKIRINDKLFIENPTMVTQVNE